MLRTLAAKIATLETRSARPAPKRADPFYLSSEWRSVVDEAKRERRVRCEDCGRTDTRLFGDHVTELQDGGAPLDTGNVRLLCGACHSRETAQARARGSGGQRQGRDSAGLPRTPRRIAPVRGRSRIARLGFSTDLSEELTRSAHAFIPCPVGDLLPYLRHAPQGPVAIGTVNL
jgi:5-methylcytosine-specific restriction enzyme A